MILLRLISWPYFRKHSLRTILTTAGIILGVAVFIGMHTANQSVLYAFRHTIDSIAGKAELQVTAGEAGFGEDVLERVQDAATVAVAVPIVEAVVDSNIPGQGSLLILGVDMTGDQKLRDYDLSGGENASIDDPLIFLAQPDSIIVTSEFADRARLPVGGRLALGTMEGMKFFTVRGILTATGRASTLGGNLAIMDVYAAQKMFGRGRRFDRIDLAVKPGRTIEECRAELRNRLGAGFQIDSPAGRGQQFEALLGAYSLMVNISSLFALFIGMFIIYNSFLIAVTERRTEIGILRALGATERQIWRLFLGEGAVVGVVGSLAGVVAGLVLARAIAAAIGRLISDLYGVAQQAADVAANPAFVVSAILVGVMTSVIAAAIPARNAARVDPVRALQKGRYQVLTAGESRLRLILAAGSGAISITCLVFGRSRPVFYFGYVLTIVVVLLLGPIMSLALAWMARPFVKWLRPVEGALAADSLIQTPRRTSASVAAVMLSLALAVAFGGMARASYASILDWVHTALNQDLLVTPSENVTVRAFRFPASVGSDLAGVPGVAMVQSVRNTRVAFRESSAMVVAVDVASLAQRAQREPVEGRADVMYRLAAAGQGLIVSDTFARLQRLRLGETIDIPAPFGNVRLPVVGIIVDYTDPQGSILMDRTLFARHWRDDSANIFRLYLRPGADAGAVKQQILERFPKRRMFVLTNAEVRAYVVQITDQWVGLTSVQIAVAVLVAMLGIVNTLTVSIADRRREIGVLKAVGGLNRQIRLTVWIEAVTIGGFGLALGLAFGAINLYYLLQIVRNDIAGIRLDYQFPWPMLLVLAMAIPGAAFVAALWPGELAVRGSLVEALEYE
jgi:putative ABC transport system permease protein